MSFDKPTRNALSRMVSAARERLKEDITAQLQTDFRLQPDGSSLSLEGLTEDQQSAALELRQLLDHLAVSEPGPEKTRRALAHNRLVREIGFTVLNRLAALRLCEERELVVECVRHGMASEGFQLFDRLTGGALGSRYETYRAFLENLFDELALDLGVLFDRRSPLSHVLPTERALQEVLDLLNDPALVQLWREDETIGWIYQYYNDEAERRQMRDESQAPRNSRELAVRNQFFTPRYVVEFLTDNTLGRIWYEMRGGETRLASQCRYLVRQIPSELHDDKVTRGQGDKVMPESESPGHPVRLRVSPRQKKDPRDIKVLDPASGSCHFLLYAFDLLTTIYVEAWADPDWPPFSETGRALRDDYPDLDTLRRETPVLILRHNLHGIDIDPRAVQIGGLALWLRAQRSFQQMGIRASERPRITRVNVVCAEPMPGERDLLDEFVADLQPPELGELVRFVFDRMQLAGEAGSLLKIEEELRAKIEELRTESGPLFAQEGDFWENAETRVLEALKDYAERAANGRAARRQLFADDAAQGFAFIDLCRKRYDVALMNPPFGAASKDSKDYIESHYPRTKNDVYAAFVERWLGRLEPSGMLGAITSRTGFFLSSFQKWREQILLQQAPPVVFADLGYGVLDSAMVETAAYCLQASHNISTVRSLFFRLLSYDGKSTTLSEAILAANEGRHHAVIHNANPITFSRVAGSAFAYWVSDNIRNLFADLDPFEAAGRSAKAGLSTSDNFRMVRTWWEIDPRRIANGPQEITPKEFLSETFQNKLWVSFSKGGIYSQFYADTHLVLKWERDGAEIKAWVVSNASDPGTTHWSRRIANAQFYFRPGLTWPLRTQRGLNMRIFPSGAVFSHKGPVAFVPRTNLLQYLGLTNSKVFVALVSLQMAFGSYEVGVIQRTPVPNITGIEAERLCEIVTRVVDLKRQADIANETSHAFSYARLLCESSDTLLARSAEWQVEATEAEQQLAEYQREIDNIAFKLYGVEGEDRQAIEESLRSGPESDEGGSEPDEEEVIAESAEDAFSLTTELLSYVVGCACGRWDSRIALDPTLAPKLQDPFEPLPVCPPGMLVGPDGLPAMPGNIVSEEWLRARPNAITLPPKGSVRQATIHDDEYPLHVAWDGILVDDPGLDENVEHPHPADIVQRVRAVLTVLWDERAESIEQEACEILSVASLRDYIRKPSGFFADHLKRYSKSRRQAPIYWPLSTASGRYTVWVYYHRLNADTLFTIVNQYVTPKIDAVQDRVNKLGLKLAESSGRAAAELRDQLGDMVGFLGELKDFRAELLRVAALPYKPDLNDGVIINAAPLSKLFRLRKWANDTAAVWRKLEAGEYDWAHLAYTIWPERVKKVCETDRSIAIAHGLEHLCKVEVKKSKGKRKKKGEEAETIEMEFEE